MAKKSDMLLVVLISVLVFLVVSLFMQNYYREKIITGMATTASATTTAVIANYFAINRSQNLTSDGIIFNIPSLPASGANATGNYGGTNSNATQFYLTVELDSNVNVDFCIKANDSLKYSTYFLDLGNYTFSNSTINNMTYPTNLSEKALVSSFFLNSTRNIAAGSSDYYRFWLDVPSSQAPGTYLNTINFKGVQTGNACN